MNRTAPALLALALLVSGAPAGADKGGAHPGPLAEIQRTNERTEKLFHSKKSADDPAARAEMRAIADSLLDYDDVARRSMATHWEALTAAQRSEFCRTLRQMIEKNYEKRLRTDLDFKVSYGEETIKGDEAVVGTTVKVKTKGKSTEAAIDYKMHKVAERWRVYDVITDGNSLVRTYREQFDKTMRNESFDALLKKMRKRIQEIEDGDKKDGDKAESKDGDKKDGDKKDGDKKGVEQKIGDKKDGGRKPSPRP